jgi:hypothetical protein
MSLPRLIDLNPSYLQFHRHIDITRQLLSSIVEETEDTFFQYVFQSYDTRLKADIIINETS